MKEIQLTQGKVALVDDEDYLFLNRWKWTADKRGRTYYVNRTITDPAINKGIKQYMHRLIMGMPPCSLEIDHKDHNGLNNQKSNLRVCTRSQNLRNSQRIKNKTSKYIGVTVTKEGIIYAYVNVNKKRYYLGVFDTEEKAAIARDKALMEREKDKRYCVFNFPVQIAVWQNNVEGK